MSYVERYSYAGALKSWASSWAYAVRTATSPLVRMVDATVRGREVTHLLGDDYIYNLSWEDPVVDHKVLGLEKDDVICMITTGGDNVLDYLIADPKLIITVDCNAHQNHLLELKMASMKALRREEFFKIFAKSDFELFQRRFSVCVLNQLNSLTRLSCPLTPRLAHATAFFFVRPRRPLPST